MSASDPKRTFRQSTLEVSCWFIKSKQLSEASILPSVAPLLERETATSRTELAPDLLRPAEVFAKLPTPRGRHLRRLVPTDPAGKASGDAS